MFRSRGLISGRRLYTVYRYGMVLYMQQYKQSCRYLQNCLYWNTLYK